jgi:hypothetical protein
LKNCTARSCLCGAAREENVPKFRRFRSWNPSSASKAGTLQIYFSNHEEEGAVAKGAGCRQEGTKKSFSIAKNWTADETNFYVWTTANSK